MLLPLQPGPSDAWAITETFPRTACTMRARAAIISDPYRAALGVSRRLQFMMAADRVRGHTDAGLCHRFPGSLVLFSLMRKSEIETLSSILLGPYLDGDHRLPFY